MGYPVTTNYKYLGLNVDNDISLRSELRAMKSREKQYDKVINMIWAHKLPGQLRYEAWATIVMPKLNYAKNLAAVFSPHIKREMKCLTYRSIKSLLAIKAKVNTDQLLEQVLGIRYEQLSD